MIAVIDNNDEPIATAKSTKLQYTAVYPIRIFIPFTQIRGLDLVLTPITTSTVQVTQHNTRSIFAISIEFIASCTVPLLFALCTLLHSGWVLCGAAFASISISLIASHTTASRYQVIIQYAYWTISLAILAWKSFSLSFSSKTATLVTLATAIPALLISEMVFFALVKQGGGELGMFGEAHADFWSGVRMIGGAVFELGCEAIKKGGNMWEGLGNMCGRRRWVQDCETTANDEATQASSPPPPYYHHSTEYQPLNGLKYLKTSLSIAEARV